VRLLRWRCFFVPCRRVRSGTALYRGKKGSGLAFQHLLHFLKRPCLRGVLPGCRHEAAHRAGMSHGQPFRDPVVFHRRAPAEKRCHPNFARIALPRAVRPGRSAGSPAAARAAIASRSAAASPWAATASPASFLTSGWAPGLRQAGGAASATNYERCWNPRPRLLSASLAPCPAFLSASVRLGWYWQCLEKSDTLPLDRRSLRPSRLPWG
jgi:hypothetical protein